MSDTGPMEPPISIDPVYGVCAMAECGNAAVMRYAPTGGGDPSQHPIEWSGSLGLCATHYQAVLADEIRLPEL